jgi:superfamily II helicase
MAHVDHYASRRAVYVLVSEAFEELKMKIIPVCGSCNHCDQIKVLVARVKSELLDMRVCFACALSAIRLRTRFEGTAAKGELEITVLPSDEIHFEIISAL